MNLTRFLSYMKHALMVAAMLTIVGISGCDDDDDNGGPQVFQGDIFELIQDAKYQQSATVPATQALDSLAKYINIYGVSGLLTGTNKTTLFAPSNQAFVNLLTTTPGFPQDISVIPPSVVAGVLAYHVVADENLKASLTSGKSLNTSFSQPDNCNPTGAGEVQAIVVNSDGTLLTGSTNSEIEITSADNLAENGVVHIVESVMIPPSVGETLTPILTTVAAPVFLASDFTIMAGLVTYADCAITNPTTTPPISNIFANPAANQTLFLVPNAVFEAGLGDTVQEVIASLAGLGYDTPTEIRGLILGHLVPGDEFTASELSAETSLTAMNATEIAVSMNGNVILLNGDIPVAVPDADNRDNGISHVIGGIIGL